MTPTTNVKDKSSYKNLIVLILLTAFVSGFWGVLNGMFTTPILNKIIVLLLLILFVSYKIDKGLFTSKWQDVFVTLFIFCLIMNFVACWINRGQNIVASLNSEEVCNMLYLLFFYVLIKIKSSVNNIERCIVVLFTIFIICFFMQYFVFYPLPIFKMIGVNSEQIHDVYSEHRFRMVSQMIGFIGYFFFLNRILIMRKRPFYYYLGILAGIVFIILLGFRIEVFAVVISSLYMIYRIKGGGVRMIGGSIIFALILFIAAQIPAVQSQFDNMLMRQSQGQEFSNTEYIRNVQLYYFLNEHAISATDYFFGSGMPNLSSEYGRKWKEMTTETGEYGQSMFIGMYGWVDWGIIGLSWMMGIPLCILLYGFMFYIIFKKYEKKYLYISAIYLFFLITSVTTIEFYRQGAFVYHAFILYLTTRIDNHMKRQEFKTKFN